MRKISQLEGRYLLYRSILSVITGILLIVYPEKSLISVMYIIGVFIIIMGVFTVISTQKYKDKYSSSQTRMMNLNSGINIVLGLILLLAPTFFVNFLMMVIGILIIIVGISKIYLLWQLKRVESTVSYGLFIIPVIIVTLGTIVVCNPFEARSVLVQVMGIAILFYGLFELMIQIKINKRYKSK